MQILETERDSARAESDNYKQMHDNEADSAVQSRTVKQQLEYQVGVLESRCALLTHTAAPFFHLEGSLYIRKGRKRGTLSRTSNQLRSVAHIVHNR